MGALAEFPIMGNHHDGFFVFAGQAPAPGFYVDNIVVTVLF